MRYHLMLFIYLQLCDGFPQNVNMTASDICNANPCKNGGNCTLRDSSGKYSCNCLDGYTGANCEIDQCSLLLCKGDEICVTENGKLICKSIQKDYCGSNPCENGGTCTTENSRKYSCNCLVRYTGENCEFDRCSALSCRDDEVCDVENDGVICIKRESTTTEHTGKSHMTHISENTIKKITTSEMSTTDEMLRNSSKTSHSFIVTSTTTEKKVKSHMPHTSENTIERITTTEMSTADELLRSSSKTSHSSITISTFITSPRTITSLSTSSATEATPDESQKQTSSTVTDNLISFGYTTEINNLIKSTYRSTKLSSEHDIYTDTSNVNSKSTTDTDDLIKCTYRSTKLSSEHDTYTETSSVHSKSTTENPQTTVTKFTKFQTNVIKSTQLQTTVERSTKLQTTETADFKLTTTFASTTEISNSTNDKSNDSENADNRKSSLSQNITTYASLGTACFAAVVAFAVGGWFIRKRCKRRPHPYNRDYDATSYISRNSDSSQSSA